MSDIWCYDLETDGLLHELTKVHCAVFQSPAGEVYAFHDHPEWVPFSGTLAELPEFVAAVREDGGELCAHNGRGFDDIVMERLLKIPVGKTQDTIVLSRLLLQDLDSLDWSKKFDEMPVKLYGTHGLKAWGYRLGCHKDESPQDWKTFTQNMLTYCVQDVAVLSKLWEYLRDHCDLPQDTIEREYAFQDYCVHQMMIGCRYDDELADELLRTLQVDRALAITDVRETWPDVDFTWWTPKKKLERTSTRSFNPRSGPQVIARFEEWGFNPSLQTKKKQKSVSEESILEFEEELRRDGEHTKADAVRTVLLYRMVSNRLSKLSEGRSGFNNYTRGGRIHGNIWHIGTGTHRCSHSAPPLAQVTSLRKPYGAEFRSLFRAAEGYTLVGGDLSGLETRLLAHYMAPFDNGAFADVVLAGDVHSHNQAILNQYCGATRDDAKTFFYALIYGASSTKLGRVLRVSPKQGGMIRKEFMKALTGFQDVIDQLQEELLTKKHAQYRDGKWGQPWLFIKRGASITGLDGRRIPVRSTHSLLNFLLQSAGAIVMKETTNLFHQVLRASGCVPHEYDFQGHVVQLRDYGQVLHVHDEIQVECKPEHVEQVSRTFEWACKETTDVFNLSCPMAGETKTGRSWLDTH